MQSRNLSANTIYTYYNRMQNFANFCKSRGTELKAVNRMDLRAYLDLVNEQGITRRTLTSHFTALTNFYDFLVFEEILSSNPVAAVKKRYLKSYKTPGGHTRQLITVEQAAALIEDMTDVRDKALMILLFKTGIRRKELIAWM
ncbi:MAG: site-specific integrase [Methanotrichaceae archaeon]|nr:site-specific integrase [Methanotrichaceae archaeon]